MINDYLQPQPKKETNYGPLTEVSKGLNSALGDFSGRSVSRRTTHGLQAIFNIEDFDDEIVEHVVHGGMILSLGLVASKNGNAKIFGWLIVLFLIVCYWNGKTTPSSLSFERVKPQSLIY